MSAAADLARVADAAQRFADAATTAAGDLSPEHVLATVDARDDLVRAATLALDMARPVG